MLLSGASELRAECISDLTFDAWLAGELDLTRERALSRHLGACERCAARKRAFWREAERFLERPDLAQQVARLSAARPRRARGRWLAPTLLAAAAAALLALYVDGPRHDTRLKGPGVFGFYVRRGAQVFRGQPGQRVRPGDQLGFSWRSDLPVYLAVLSLDAKRVVSTYYPAPGAQRQLAPSGAEIELANAVELDDTLGREWIFVVSCPKAPSLEALRKTLAEKGELTAPPGCRLERIALFKEPPP